MKELNQQQGLDLTYADIKTVATTVSAKVRKIFRLFSVFRLTAKNFAEH